MKYLNLLAAAVLVLTLQHARAQETSKIGAPGNTDTTDDARSASAETEEFSGTDAENGPGFRFLGRTWIPSFFDVASVETDKVSNGGRLSTYSYLTFGTRVADNLRFKLRLPFTYATAGTDRFNGTKSNPDELMMQDIILTLSSTNFVLLPADIGIYWEGRVYLPNGKYSRQAGQMARILNGVILEKKITRVWGLEYQGKLSYYAQSRRVYALTFQDDNGFDVSATANTKRWDLDHWINVWATVAPGFSLGGELGQEQTGYNQSPAENKFKSEQRLYKVGPSLRYQTAGGSRFILNYEDKVDRDANGSELGQFLAKNTQVTLLSWISF